MTSEYNTHQYIELLENSCTTSAILSRLLQRGAISMSYYEKYNIGDIRVFLYDSRTNTDIDSEEMLFDDYGLELIGENRYRTYDGYIINYRPGITEYFRDELEKAEI